MGLLPHVQEAVNQAMKDHVGKHFVVDGISGEVVAVGDSQVEVMEKTPGTTRKATLFYSPTKEQSNQMTSQV